MTIARPEVPGAGDTLPAAYLPWSLVQQKNFDLDELPTLYDAGARQTYPLRDYPALLRPIVEQRAEIVFGNRFRPLAMFMFQFLG